MTVGSTLIGFSCGADGQWCRGGASSPQQVDYCVVNPIARNDSRIPIQHARLHELFATERASFAHWTFRCDGAVCSEGWNELSAKTHALFGAALRWTPRWRALLKLDLDGFMCLTSPHLARLQSHLETVYAGLLTYPPGTPGQNPWQRNASKYYFQGQNRMEWRAKHNRLATAPYMQGAAYLVGRKVASFAVRHSFADLVHFSSWEDASVGLWTNGMAGRTVVPLRGSPLHCPLVPLKQNKGATCVGSDAADVLHRCDALDIRHVCRQSGCPSEGKSDGQRVSDP